MASFFLEKEERKGGTEAGWEREREGRKEEGREQQALQKTLIVFVQKSTFHW